MTTSSDNVRGGSHWHVCQLGSVQTMRTLCLSFYYLSPSLFQESMGLIRTMCAEEGGGTELADKLTEKLAENLKETLSDNKVG